MKKVDINIDQENLSSMAQDLNKLLSDEFTLYVKTLNYHWNICGPHFPGLHKFFEEQYESLFKIIDKVAERVRALGFISFGCQQEFLKYTQINEDQFNDIPEEQTMLKNLLADHETVIKSLRDLISYTEKIKDYGSNNLLADLIEKHEKITWMIRSTIK